MSAVIIICTRKESARLPGKALLKIAGVPAIEHILRRVEGTGLMTVLAVPYDQRQDFYPFVEKRKNWACVYEGDADSPLHRMAAVLAAQRPMPEFVVRITHDDILIDANTMLDLIYETSRQSAGYGISPGIVEGAGVEVISARNLLEAAKKHAEPTEYISWHVTGDVYNPKVARLIPRASIRRDYRLTMDYPEDAQVLEIVLRSVGPEATLDRICAFLDSHRALLNINKLPLISIYTPAYNSAPYIGEALRSSLVDQDLDNIEHLLVDAGSDDGTLAAAAFYAGDRRLKFLLGEGRLTCAEASNKAVKAARGRFVLRLDADDLLVPNILPPLIDLIGEAKVLYCGYRELTGETLGPIMPPNPELAGGALMRRDWITHVGFGDVKHHDGLELFGRIRDKWPIAYSKLAAFRYRVRQDSLSRDPANQEERERVGRILDGSGRETGRE